MADEIFVKLSTEEKKTNFKSKCILEGLKMRDVIEKAVDEFIEKGKYCEFMRK